MSQQVEPLTSGATWTAIRDARVACARIESEIQIVALKENQAQLEEELTSTRHSVETMGTSEPQLQTHRVRRSRWAVFAFAALVLSAFNAWLSISWIESLGWQAVVIAGSLCLIPIIGWKTMLDVIGERARRATQWRVYCGLNIIVVLASMAAGGAYFVGRSAGVTFEETRRQPSLHGEISDEAAAERIAAARKLQRVLNMMSLIAGVLLVVAGEVAAGLAFHEAAKHHTVVRTVTPFFDRERSLRGYLAANVAAQEEVRRKPDLLYATLTARGLEEEAARLQAAEKAAQNEDSVLPVLKWVFGAFAGIVALLAFAYFATAAETGNVDRLTIIAVDTSDSMTRLGDLGDHLRVVEREIADAVAGTRVLVLTVTAASFSETPVFDVTAPRDGGRFGQYLDAWKVDTRRRWRARVTSLPMGKPGSDLIGVLRRVQLECQGLKSGHCRVVLVSDLRHVGDGLNFEKPPLKPEQALATLAARQRVPDLSGVEVVALGVHTLGVDDRHWHDLRAFWVKLFDKAGASLRVYSPGLTATSASR